MEGSDVCFAPVLDWDEAPRHPHNQARQAFVSVDGVVQPSPAPRFSRTPPDAPAGARHLADCDSVIAEWRAPASQAGPSGAC